MKPKLAITVGEISGVGPELAIQCASRDDVLEKCVPVLYGPQDVLDRIAKHLDYRVPDSVQDIGTCDWGQVQPGRFDAITGRASFSAVEAAIEDAMAGRVDAIVTGPIQKEAWHAAGIQFPGHTELLADRTGIDDFAMMLAGPELAVILCTIHIAIADVPKQLTPSRVLKTIEMAAQVATARWKSSGSPADRPARIAVCGLNPHAGENGLFSHGEEERIIEPAIAAARELPAIANHAIEIIGPLPPDTAFTPAMRSQVDVFVCQYHDQGLIPLKALSFDDGVNVTLGLPIIRTSVDHGTAMDLAWQGKANPQSFLSAIDLAVQLCRSRAPNS